MTGKLRSEVCVYGGGGGGGRRRGGAGGGFAGYVFEVFQVKGNFNSVP